MFWKTRKSVIVVALLAVLRASMSLAVSVWGFFKTRKLVVIAVSLAVLLVSLGFYSTYAPDYRSSVRSMILWQLNGATETDNPMPESSRLRGWSSWGLHHGYNLADPFKRVFRIDAHAIGFHLTGKKWYSHNAKQWEIYGTNAFLTDSYFAVPVFALGDEIAISIFRNSGSEWVFDQEIKPESFVLALEGEVLVVGNSAEKRIFRRVDDVWILEQTIAQRVDEKAVSRYSDPGLALSGNTIAVGWNDGLIELFDYNQGKWVSDFEIDRDFLQLPRSNKLSVVDLESGRLVLVSYNDAEAASKYNKIARVHVLKRENGNWVIEQEITEVGFPQVQLTTTGYHSDRISVAISGNSLVVGNSVHNAVYVFRRDAHQWVLAETITEASFPEINLEKRPSYSDPSFGYGVALRAGTLVVTEHVHAVYVFTEDEAGNWKIDAKILEGNNRFRGLKITENGTILILESNEIYAFERDMP